jgi:hypothetical protein
MKPEAIKLLEDKVLDFDIALKELDKSNIPEICKFYKAYTEFFDELEKITEIAGTIKKKLSYEILPEAFENEGVDSVKLSGRNFIVNVRLNASIPLDMREIGHAWLRDNGLGSIIVPVANPKTLSSAVKEYILENGKNPPETAIKIHHQKYMSMKKA